MTMHGDFSFGDDKKKANINAVLHQQGRVILDRDLNDQVRMTLGWQDTAGRDMIGKGVVAVPSDQPDAFKVVDVDLLDESVRLKVRGGRVWVNGMSVSIPDGTYTARYLGPPFQQIPAFPYGAQGTRDAVVLEVWRESVSAFADLATWIEPALGGPDTTERVITAKGFRLFRLDGNQNCNDVYLKTADDFSKKGKLKVSLHKPLSASADCPVTDSGGYAGIEHFLYRIEIALTKSPTIAYFKWSRYNGGLVGRGEFTQNGPDVTVTITDNLQPIITSDLRDFYLEVIQFDENDGCYHVTYGAQFSLTSDNTLEMSGSSPSFGEAPTIGAVFFRLWDGIKPVSDYTGNEKELVDGIFLKFDNADPGVHYPGDYWTFPVRAATANPEILVDSEPPHGVHYHRVPLAVLKWGENPAPDSITDCRVHFRPLIDRNICCSFTVGDGKTSFGDYNSLEEAIENLPEAGGEICVLPGDHSASVTIQKRTNIRIRGCGVNTRVIPRKTQLDWIFSIEDSQGITIENLTMVSFHKSAIAAIRVISSNDRGSADIAIKNNSLFACSHAIATKGSVRNVQELSICNNRIQMLNQKGGLEAIAVMVENCLIERNVLTIISKQTKPDQPESPEDRWHFDPCENPVEHYDRWLITALKLLAPREQGNAAQAMLRLKRIWNTPGGILIEGGSERVVIRENLIIGGTGNGITLGRGIPTENAVTPAGLKEITMVRKPDTIADRLRDTLAAFTEKITGEPGVESVKTDASGTAEGGRQFNIPPFIRDIVIERNEIASMELCGICGFDICGSGIPGENARVFNIFGTLVSRLFILQNYIHDCLSKSSGASIRLSEVRAGLGGIALGPCMDLVIRDNVITENGSFEPTHACGIYVFYSNMTEIVGNTITGNGYHGAFKPQDLKGGLSGGIVVDKATGFPGFNAGISGMVTGNATGMSGDSPALVISAKSESVTISPETPAIFRNALTVHQNTIDQPLGNALVAKSYGPVSVTNNTFVSRKSCMTTGSTFLENITGSVFLMDIGSVFNYLTLKNVQSIFENQERKTNLGPLFILLKLGQADVGSETIYHENQVIMGPDNEAIVSQFLVSSSDISFSGNQSKCMKFQDTLFINTIILGMTLRASENRFRESDPWMEGTPSPILSLLDLSLLMNHTTQNQADHCIIPLRVFPLIVDQGNLMFLPTIQESLGVSTPCTKDGTIVMTDLDRTVMTNREYKAKADEMMTASKPEQPDEFRVMTEKTEINLMAAFTTEYHRELQDIKEKIGHIRDLGIQEVTNAEIRFGPDHPNTVAAKVMVDLGDGVINKIAAQDAISKTVIKIQPVEEDEIQVQGRLVDNTSIPIEGATISLEDERGKKIDTVVTNTSGLYSFVTKAVDPGKTLSIAVYDKDKNLISRTTVKVTAGELRIADLKLDKEASSRLKKGTRVIDK